jgi:hypothetical protein
MELQCQAVKRDGQQCSCKARYQTNKQLLCGNHAKHKSKIKKEFKYKVVEKHNCSDSDDSDESESSESSEESTEKSPKRKQPRGKKQCQAFTRKKTQCSYNAQSGQMYCGIHNKQEKCTYKRTVRWKYVETISETKTRK